MHFFPARRALRQKLIYVKEGFGLSRSRKFCAGMMFTLWEMKADAGCTTAKSNPKKQTSFTDATHHSEDLKKISMSVLVRYSEDVSIRDRLADTIEKNRFRQT
jgi:hypothetical protein